MKNEDFNTFRPFIYASVITWAMTAKQKSKRESERKKGHSRKSSPYSRFKDLPNRYLSEILELNQCSISRYKEIANKAGYIKIHHQYDDTRKAPEYLHQMRKYSEPKIANSLVIRNGSIQIRKADLIFSNIRLCYLKRLKTSK
jgi:hypothetical protein